MNTGWRDDSTVGPAGKGRGPRGGAASPRAVPALTVLFHPDHPRVGERTLLAEIELGREALLGRNAPEFFAPGHCAGAPLSDCHLSREPLVLRAVPQRGIALQTGASRTGVVADGVEVAAERVFSAGEIERGIVLELSERIVLLLHRLAVLPTPASGQLGMLGESDGLWRVRAAVHKVADLDLPVLIQGETGTGKELVARALHAAAGDRRGGPFVAVNLGAIPVALMAAELFGAARGAFTGSVRTQDGYFRRAHRGTLFLDEVGEAPLEVQVMLLRALEEGEIHPLGMQAPVPVDVRVVAATDSRLDEKVKAGGFKAPLLHRLAGYEIHVPPLRERRDDIGRLFFHFLHEELAELGEAHGLEGAGTVAAPWLAPALLARLAGFDWPGNVRQLHNVTRQLAIAGRGSSHPEVVSVVERLLLGRQAERPAADPDRAAGPGNLEHPPEEGQQGPGWRRPSGVSQPELLEALRAHRWNLKATAAALRVSRTSLYALIDGCPGARRVADLAPDEITRCHLECGGDLVAMAERLEVSSRALGRRMRELRLV